MLTLIVGLGAGSFGFDQSPNVEVFKAPVFSAEKSGRSASCRLGSEAENRFENSAASSSRDTHSLKILAKPRAVYTDEARRNLTAGAVVLRVTFLASGEIGAVTPVAELPDGLTEQAVAAARAIRFEPAKRNGQNVSVTKTVEYQFTIY